MMAGQARQIALRKLEVAVLSHGAFQAQRNGFCALLSDVLACYLSFTHASRLQDFIQIGRTSTSITASQAINLKCKAVQMRCQAGHEIKFDNDLIALIVHTIDRDGADVCMLLRHSSAAARAAVRHPPRGGRLNGWHAVRQMLCIASYHVISIHPTDSVWSWKSDLNR